MAVKNDLRRANVNEIVNNFFKISHEFLTVPYCNWGPCGQNLGIFYQRPSNNVIFQNHMDVLTLCVGDLCCCCVNQRESTIIGPRAFLGFFPNPKETSLAKPSFVQLRCLLAACAQLVPVRPPLFVRVLLRQFFFIVLPRSTVTAPAYIFPSSHDATYIDRPDYAKVRQAMYKGCDLYAWVISSLVGAHRINSGFEWLQQVFQQRNSLCR